MHHQGNWRHVRSLMSRLAPIMLIPILSGCLLFSKTSMFSRGDGWYHYDPTTLPQALERGEPLSLTPEATVATSDVLDSKPVQWTQADFLQIADAFQQQELAESLSAWKFSQLWFELYCADVAFGPQHLTIELYREYPRAEGGMRLASRAIFSPVTSVWRGGALRVARGCPPCGEGVPFVWRGGALRVARGYPSCGRELP